MSTPTPNDILRLFLENDQEETDELPIVHTGEWEQNHKTQLRELIVHHVGSDTFWEFQDCRSGSYHTDWYYAELEEPAKVVLMEVITKVWAAAPKAVPKFPPFVNEALPL